MSINKTINKYERYTSSANKQYSGILEYGLASFSLSFSDLDRRMPDIRRPLPRDAITHDVVVKAVITAVSWNLFARDAAHTRTELRVGNEYLPKSVPLASVNLTIYFAELLNMIKGLKGA